MKKILNLLVLVLLTPSIFAQEVKHLSAYVKPNAESRYTISLYYNTIWWADPNIGQRTKVSTPK